jgi:hypothetical protein
MITLELPADVEARLAAEAHARGLDLPTYAAQLLETAAAPVSPAHRKRTPEETRAWLDELAQFSDKIPAMPGETFSRDMIYQDHD